MKRLYTSMIALFLTCTLIAQIDQLSVGASYTQQTFYTIGDGNSVQVDPTSWDIAFALGGQDAGIFVNESVATSFSMPLPQVELYLADATTFEAVDSAEMTRIYNDNVSWSEGAFNHMKDVTIGFDFGWGTYDPGTNTVNGSRAFVIHLRNGDYKKLEIQSLSMGTYTFRYANLDGTDELTQTVAKSDFDGKTLAYFSIENNESIDLEPENWDFQFTRYTTSLDDGMGGIISYVVTGVLINKELEVAQADGVDPATVDPQDYESNYVTDLEVIGHDWKSFDLDNFQWVIPTDLAYFVKSNGQLWKIQFLDFEGSSTGTATLEKTLIGDITSVTPAIESLPSFKVYPNPADKMVQLTFDLATDQSQARVELINNLGQLVYTQQIVIQEGEQTAELFFDLPTGIYSLSLRLAEQLITQQLFIK